MSDTRSAAWDGLTARQRELRERARDVPPVAVRRDQNASYPHEVLRAARRTGLFNTVIPASYGGPGLSAMEGVPRTLREAGAGCGQQGNIGFRGTQ